MMLNNRTLAIDGGIAVALIVALGIVFLADRGQGPRQVDPGVVVVEQPKEPEAPPPPPMKLAVTPPQFDDMGKLLSQLGSGYPYTEFPLEDLEDVSKLTQFDVLFLTCGGVPKSWVVGDVLVAGDRPGVSQVRVNEQILARVKSALRTFVGRGGTLYASDWRFNDLSIAFPELFDRLDVVTGAVQTVDAEVVDPGLRSRLGSKVSLRFDLTGWFPAQTAGAQTTTYLRGDYRPARGGPPITAPLLVKVTFEQGTIIFTSFHNEKVNSEVETELLKFLVFAAVTARESAQTQRTMISGGFKPQRQDLLSASPNAPSATQTYSNPKRGRLRFALALRIKGPTSS